MTHKTIQKMLIGAYQKVSNKKEAINAINIFPVPDQDTGDNLAFTLQGVFDAINKQSFANIIDLKNAAIDGAICNASGNVGIITTGFLNGFLSNLTETEISTKNFTQAFALGLSSARNSIQNPQEGTILDVIKGANDSLSQETDSSDIKKILKNAIVSAKKALNDTQLKMDLYKRAGTVDAGGYGFLLILEGFLESLNKKTNYNDTDKKPTIQTGSFFQIISHRYEVISLLESLTIDKKTITKQLINYGDCLDIVEANQKIKIHIHTDTPDNVVELISTFGSVVHMRTTDMNQQIDQIKTSKKSVGLVVDDASGLDINFATQYDIAIVPFKTSWDKIDKKFSYQNMSIYRKMELFKNKTQQYGWPKTSQPTLENFLKNFKEQLQKYNYIICITTSTVISGSYNSAIQARSLLSSSDQKRVIIPDFKQMAPGQAMLAIKAVKLIEQEYTYKQIEKQLLSIAKNIDVFGTPKNMIWITTGGRVSGNIAKLVHFLQKIKVKPMLVLTTKNISLKKIYLGDKSSSTLFIQHLNKFYKSSNIPLELVIQHGDDDPELKKIKQMLDPNRFKIIQETILSPVIGIHTGPGTFIIGILKPSKK